MNAAMIALMGLLAAQPDDPGPRGARPERPLAELFLSEDYPVEALRQDREGTVGFRLEIDSTGRITRCDIERSAGKDLDRATCAIVRARARFHPARDKWGRPLPDSFTARVTWRIQETPVLMAIEAQRFVITVRWAEPDPVCTETFNDGPPEEMRASDCLATVGEAMLAVREGRGAFQLNLVSWFVPPGEPFPDLTGAEYGERLWFEEAELTIADDGSIERCRSVRVEGSARDLIPDDPGTCPAYATKQPFFVPARSPAGSRLMRVRNALFIRRRGGD